MFPDFAGFFLYGRNVSMNGTPMPGETIEQTDINSDGITDTVYRRFPDGDLILALVYQDVNADGEADLTA